MGNRISAQREGDLVFMREALRLARLGYGRTSPNPMVGAVLVKAGHIVGRGWHRAAGKPHAEIYAIHAAQRAGADLRHSTLYVTLEPCSTWGRTPPCTDALKDCRIERMVVAAVDPNPRHAGRSFGLLSAAGIEVSKGLMEKEAQTLNESFNHWVVNRTPFVTIKAAMTLDGKIASADGHSQWITGPVARQLGMKLRRGADAILVGVNTILRDNPRLTLRGPMQVPGKQLRRIILDSHARTPLNARVTSDASRSQTTVFVTERAPLGLRRALTRCVNVVVAPVRGGKVNVAWVMSYLGRENVTSLLVEGGGAVNAAFLKEGLAHRIAFFFAPKVLCGREAIRAVAGESSFQNALDLRKVEWKPVGPDLFLTARIA